MMICWKYKKDSEINRYTMDDVCGCVGGCAKDDSKVNDIEVNEPEVVYWKENVSHIHYHSGQHVTVEKSYFDSLVEKAEMYDSMKELFEKGAE